MSAGRPADSNIKFHVGRSDILSKLESNGALVGRGSSDAYNRMYVLPSPRTQASLALDSLSDHDTKMGHRRLAQINVKELISVHKFADGVPRLVSIGDIFRACRLRMAHKLPFFRPFCTALAVGQIMHFDIVSKFTMSYPDRYQYECTFFDDHSCYTLLAFSTVRMTFTTHSKKCS